MKKLLLFLVLSLLLVGSLSASPNPLLQFNGISWNQWTNEEKYFFCAGFLNGNIYSLALVVVSTHGTFDIMPYAIVKTPIESFVDFLNWFYSNNANLGVTIGNAIMTRGEK